MASDELVSGKKLGRFTLVRRIALGGMAEIWLALDPEEEARRAAANSGWRPAPSSSDPDKVIPAPKKDGPPHIALKILLSSYAKDPTFRAMFLDEVNIASRLAHENIVQIYGAFELEGHLVQAMELVDGRDFRRVLSSVARSGAGMPVPLALLVAREMARALGYAHMKKAEDGKPLDIVHRDVSPHNVMITRDGSVKLLDFGIARAAERLTRTRTGVIKGKVAYMSPEQALALSVTYRTDIFATGIVLWESLAMTRLFKAESDPLILERVIKADVPPIRDYNPDVPPEAATLLEQMLAQRAPMRPESMKAVENTLTRILLKSFKEEETSKQALASWVLPHLESDRPKDGGEPQREGTPIDPLAAASPAMPMPSIEPAKDPADRTLAMRVTDQIGASGSHPVAMTSPEEPAMNDTDKTMPDAAPTMKFEAPTPSQIGITTTPVRTRDIVREDQPTPVATATPATPVVTPGTPDPADHQKFRLPTKSEIHDAVDNVKTVPFVVDPNAFDAKAAAKIMGQPPPKIIGEAPPKSAPSGDETVSGDLGSVKPQISHTDPTWTENPSGEHNFAPVKILAAERSSGQVPVHEKDSTPPLVVPAPAEPPNPTARLYQMMLALAIVVIVLLVVLLWMK